MNCTEPVRILQVVTQMNRGGMENRLMDIYRSIDRERVQFDFYTFRRERGQFDEEILALGGKVFYNEPLSVKKLFAIPSRLQTFLAEHPEYSVCHAHLNQWCGLILEGARRAGVPCRVAHARTALQGGGHQAFVKNFIKRLYAKSPTHRFAVSKKASDWLYEKQGGEVWPNAIESEKFLFDSTKRTQTRKSLGVENAFCVLHVGNLRSVKNHAFLFSVFAEIVKKEPNAHLLLAGRGELEASLRARAKELNLSEKITFLGSREDIPDLLSAADVFIFPSFYEGLPGSVLEAQASSLPCLISNTIAEEVFLSEACKSLSIQADPALWAEEALKHKDHPRVNQSALFAKTGYDVRALAERLCAFYQEQSQKGN